MSPDIFSGNTGTKKYILVLEVPNLKIRSQLGFEEIITRLPSTNSSKTLLLVWNDVREQIELGTQDGNGKNHRQFLDDP